MTSAAATEERVARRFASQLDICERLQQKVWDERPARSEVTNEAHAVLVAILRRTLDSYDATLRLCRVGLPVQALMTVRSMFEDMVSAFWLCLPEKRDVALKRIRDQADYLVLLSNDVVRAYPHRYEVEADDHPDLEDRRKEFEGTFRPYATRTWVGDLHSAIQDIKPRWEELGGDGETLAIYYAAVHWQANLRLHNTSTAIQHGLKTYDSRERQLDDEDLLYLDVALRAAYMCLAGLAHLVADEFGHKRDKLSQLTDEAQQIFLTDPAPLIQKLGRNDPCWCGSGKKFKRCHGA
jgi:hypothetical protein